VNSVFHHRQIYDVYLLSESFCFGTGESCVCVCVLHLLLTDSCLRSRYSLSYSRNSPHFIVPDVLLFCSQEPTSEPVCDESSPHPPCFFKTGCNICLPSASGLSNSSFCTGPLYVIRQSQRTTLESVKGF
jgi:hypothetical protein